MQDKTVELITHLNQAGDEHPGKGAEDEKACEIIKMLGFHRRFAS